MIGRSEQVALCLDDPRVSEAHAMVSLRGQHLVLLALRGRFRVDGEIVGEVILQPGVDIELYKDFWLQCDDVVLPEVLLGLSIPNVGESLLTKTTSVFIRPDSGAHTIQPGFVDSADVVFWRLGDHWHYRVLGEGAQTLSLESTIDIQGVHIDVVAMHLRHAGIAKTRQTDRPILHLDVTRHCVKIQMSSSPNASMVTGVPGKLLASLAQYQYPQPWEVIADQVWPDDLCSPHSLRRRFDVGLLRLREKLQQLDLPGDLLQMDGSGLISLALEDDDTVTLSAEMSAPR